MTPNKTTRLTKVKIIGGKRYELAKTSMTPEVLWGLAEGYLERGSCSVKVVHGAGFECGLYVSKVTSAKWKPSTKKNLGAKSIVIDGKKYERGDVYRLKKNATYRAERERYKGALTRIIKVPIGWALYYRIGRARMPRRW